MNAFPTWAVGALLAAVIALTARRLRWLTASGSVAAWVAGTVAMGAGWDWGMTLVAYFVAASLLSGFRATEKVRRAGGRLGKQGARDAAQVASNGGVYVAAALAHWMTADPLWQCIGAGALAASAADTWATELGSLSRVSPRSVVSGTRVPVGTSGGVTSLGLLAAAGGGLYIAVHLMAWHWRTAAVVAAIAGGVIGSLLDSVLGATAQARFWCPTCGTGTEARRHVCGTMTDLRAGVRWLDNDGVNALATAGGAAVGYVAALWIP